MGRSMFRLLVVLLTLCATAAPAQDRRPSHCIAIADAAPGISYIQKASYTAPVPQFSVRITYIDHAMFLIQTPGGLSAIPISRATPERRISSPTWSP